MVLHSWPASWASVCRCPLTLGQAGSAGELACQEWPLSNEEWERVGKYPRVLTSWWVDAGLSPTQPFGSQTGQEGEPSPGGQGGSGSGTVLSPFHVLTHSQCFLKSPHCHHHLRQAPCTQIPVSDRISWEHRYDSEALRGSEILAQPHCTWRQRGSWAFSAEINSFCIIRLHTHALPQSSPHPKKPFYLIFYGKHSDYWEKRILTPFSSDLLGIFWKVMAEIYKSLCE